MRIPFLGELILCSPQKPCPAAPGMEKRLAMLALLIRTLIEKDLKMGHEVEDLVAEVANIKSVIDAVITDHAALVDRIDAAVVSADLSAVAGAVVDLKAQADRLRSVVATPASNTTIG